MNKLSPEFTIADEVFVFIEPSRLDNPTDCVQKGTITESKVMFNITKTSNEIEFEKHEVCIGEHDLPYWVFARDVFKTYNEALQHGIDSLRSQSAKATKEKEETSLLVNHLTKTLNYEESMTCSHCTSGNHGGSVCCDHGNCQARPGVKGITNCIHCGGELREVDGSWYHWSQFDAEELGEPQDYVSEKPIKG